MTETISHFRANHPTSRAEALAGTPRDVQERLFEEAVGPDETLRHDLALTCTNIIRERLTRRNLRPSHKATRQGASLVADTTRSAGKAASRSHDMSDNPFDPDEVRVCMVIAFALAGACLTIAYRLVG
jgi:hypothetical protein